MYWRPLYLGFFSRCAWTLSAWRRSLRVCWYKIDKGLVMFFAILCLVLSGCGYFAYSRHSQEAQRQSLQCLALNVYYEARGESKAGQVAVAEVTMNRVASKYYPKTVCEVVYQRNWDPLRGRYVAAFTWTEFNKLSAPTGRAWERARDVAEAVYYRRWPQPPELRGALHYHSIYVKPNWSEERKLVGLIGNHYFYN